jgi:acetyl-CoA C-acetyltransferase
MRQAYIFDYVRTPRGRGKSDGSLHTTTPIELSAQSLRALRDRNGLDTATIDDVVLGCVSAAGEQGANIGRLAALHAGYAESVPGKHVNRFCASGLEAVNIAAAQVTAGQCDLAVAGGVESMSRVPMGSDGGAWFTDPQVIWRTGFVPQGICADLIATRAGFSRDHVDRFALESHEYATRAWAENRFAGSLIPVTGPLGDIRLDRDEHLRTDTTLAALSTLKPAFADVARRGGYGTVAMQRYPEVEAIDHVHTAGNSSGIVDGAAALLIGDRACGARLGLTPRARVVSCASVGTEPTIMLTGPTPATRRALQRAGMTVADIDLFEVNEAFAAVVLLFMRELEVPRERVNVNGGAIALGHPLGATGAILLGTALDELERRDGNTALITLCVGGGMGTATVIERV